MALHLVPALALMLQAAPSQAQFEGVAELKIVALSSMREGGRASEPVVTSLRLFFTERAWRMEKEVAPPESLSSLVRDMLGGHDTFRLVALGKSSDPARSWIRNDRTKSYALLVVAPSSSRERADPCWTVRRTGNDVVAGLACENVSAQRKDGTESWEACLSSDLPSTMMESLTRLSRAPAESGDHVAAETWIATAHRSGVNGRPLRAISRGPDGAEKFRIEVVTVERRALPASLFEIPQAYRQTNSFRVTAQSAKQERHLERDEKILLEQMKRWRPEDRKRFEPLYELHGREKP